jgi:hypothetical protein
LREGESTVPCRIRVVAPSEYDVDVIVQNRRFNHSAAVRETIRAAAQTQVGKKREAKRFGPA